VATIKEFTIQELSDGSNVTVASIKYYVREGLLPPPVPGRPRRAYYDERHARRLATIRALREVAGLSIEVIHKVLVAVESPGADAVDVIAPAIDALVPTIGDDSPALTTARIDVAKAFARSRLAVRPNAGARETIARTLVSLRKVGSPIQVEHLVQYIEWLRPLAQSEIEREPTRTILHEDKEASLEIAVLGTVLFEPLIAGLRRALHEHYTTRLVRHRKRGA
jgi:DNA-binding transcriptional MerR regulator